MNNGEYTVIVTHTQLGRIGAALDSYARQCDYERETYEATKARELRDHIRRELLERAQ